MNYPLISEYTQAILSAEDNFDELSYLRAVLDESGMPVMSSGNFAVVYKMQDSRDGKFYAVKCFTRDQDNRQKSYKYITDYISELSTDYLITTKYLENELFVDSNQTFDTEFPILLMDWVDGIVLDEYISQNLSDKKKIQLLYDNFLKLINWLLPSHLAHGDLKPDNILITSQGEIRLIDYDGMYVPSMFGQKSPELGTPQFQYSNRKQSDFNEYIDDYSAIYIALLLKLASLEQKTLDFYLTLSRVDFVAYVSKYIEDVEISKLLSTYLLVNSLGFIERETLSNTLFDELKRDRSLEIQLIHDALNGDSQSMIQLGDTYSRAKFTPSNASKALDWYNLARLLGDVNSSCGICRHYYHFHDDYHGIKKYCEGPLHVKMLENNIDFALCREAEECMFKDKDHAITFFTESAQHNFAPAKYWLAISTMLGTSNFELLKEVANQNFSRGVKALGDRYQKGESVAKDSETALFYYEKAAILGNDMAQYYIALAYRYGWDGYEKDDEKFVYWMTKSAHQGHDDAVECLARYYISKVPNFTDSAGSTYSKKAYNMLIKYHDSKNAEILVLIAYCYMKGIGITRNYNEAYAYFEKAIHTYGGSSFAEIILDNVFNNFKIENETHVQDSEVLDIGTTNSGTYSKDMRRFLRYWGTYGEEFSVEEGCEVLCDDCFNDLYSECDGHYLETLILPKSLRRIGNNVFCASINNIVCKSPNFKVDNDFLLSNDGKVLYRYFGDSEIIDIPTSVVYIKGGAFTEKLVKEIHIPETVEYIGDNPFAGINLQFYYPSNITEDQKNKLLIINKSDHFEIIGEALYSKMDKRLIACWTTSDNISIKAGTKIIGKNAFWQSNIQRLYIYGSHIVSIDNHEFIRCFKLSSIHVDDEEEKYYQEIFPENVKKIITDLPF